MNKKFLGLMLLSASICTLVQASEVSLPQLLDTSTTPETLASRIQKIEVYHDFAKKQLDVATAHPKFALEISSDSGKYEKGECDARLIEWKMTEELFREVLACYERNDLEAGDKKLNYAFNCAELTVVRAARYWCRKEKNIQIRTPRIIMSELLEAISDTPGSPAEYPGARERLLDACNW